MKKVSRILMSILLILVMICIFYKVEAASASITASSTNVTTGTAVTITGSVNAGGWNLQLSGEGESKGLVGQTSTTDNSSASAEITFTPTRAGTYTFKLTGDMTDYYTDVTEPVKESIKITVTEASAPTPTPTVPDQQHTTPTEPSVDMNSAVLSNLKVKPVDFSGFRKNVFGNNGEYSVTVENDVTEVKIETYIPTGSGAKVTKITGNTNLKEGTNIVEVTVTSGNGQKTNVYKVFVTRKVAGTEIDPNSSEEIGDTTNGETIGLSKLELKGFTLTPEFKVDVYRYTIELEDDKIYTLEEIRDLITAEVNFEGGTCEITGPEEFDIEEENDVIISVKDADGREIAIYTIVFNYPKKEVEDTAKVREILEIEPIQIDQDKMIIISTITILFLIAMIFGIQSCKQRKILIKNGLIKKKEKEDYEEDYEDENEQEEDSKNEIDEGKKNQEKNENYLKDIFENDQMNFEPEDKDFEKRKNKKGKHSS